MVNIPEQFSEIHITLDPDKPFRSLQECGEQDRPILNSELHSLVEVYVNRTLWNLTAPGTTTSWTGPGEVPRNWAGPVKAQYTLSGNVLTIKFTPERIAQMEHEPYGPISGRSIEDTVIRTQVANRRNMFVAWLSALQSEGHVVQFQ